MTLPQYVDLGGSYTYRHPYQFTGMNAQGLVLKASYAQLTATTDKWLNCIPGAPFRYAPLLPFVVCNPCWIDRITCTDPKWKAMGWMRETDFNFGYFVGAFKGTELDHVAVAMAYLVVDNPLTVSSGREVFGYRKAFGTMEYVAGTYQPAAASTWVYKKFSPDQELELAEVARILAPPAWGAATRLANLEFLRQLAELAVGDFVLDVMVAIEHLMSHLMTMSLPVVYLLQLRDVEQPDAASYQAVIEGPMQITRLNSAWMLPEGFSVKLTDYPSYPIISDLGIEVDGSGIAKSVLSYQLNFNCLMPEGKVMAAAGRP
jgi:hypothetical protein